MFSRILFFFFLLTFVTKVSAQEGVVNCWYPWLDLAKVKEQKVKLLMIRSYSSEKNRDSLTSVDTLFFSPEGRIIRSAGFHLEYEREDFFYLPDGKFSAWTYWLNDGMLSRDTAFYDEKTRTFSMYNHRLLYFRDVIRFNEKGKPTEWIQEECIGCPSMDDPNGDWNASTKMTYTYDKTGSRLLSRNGPNDEECRFSYDEKGRMKEAGHFSELYSIDYTESYEYNEKGLLKTILYKEKGEVRSIDRIGYVFY